MSGIATIEYLSERWGMQQLIASIGDADFIARLVEQVGVLSGADCGAVLRFGKSGAYDLTPTPLVPQARRFPLGEPRAAGVVEQSDGIDVAALSEEDLGQVVCARFQGDQPVFLCMQVGEDWLGFGLTARAVGCAPVAGLQHFFRAVPLLLSLIGKHVDMLDREEQLSSSISSLAEIEGRIAAAPEQLSQRESDVCARILYGLSTIGTALDLGVGEESVMTYRKRAYRRLGISSRRELLCWYLNLKAVPRMWRAAAPSCSAVKIRAVA